MFYIVLVLQSALSVFGLRGVYEQPKYDVIERLSNGVEVRRYAPRLAAEVTVSAADAAAGRDDAFRVLAGYIFGANRPAGAIGDRAGQKVAMTTPVQVARGGGQKVAMTTPVQTASDDAGMTMRFFLPAKLTANTAPLPQDSRVRVVTVPAETVAVLRFAGRATDAKVAARTQSLNLALDGSTWASAGPAYTLYYDPPFTIPLLRRNEVVVPVAARGR